MNHFYWLYYATNSHRYPPLVLVRPLHAAETELGWQRKVSFKELVAMMVDSDMRELAGISAKEFREKNA